MNGAKRQQFRWAKGSIQCAVKLLGDILIKIPSDTMNYLAYLYGDTWSTPNPNWDWRKDGPTQKIRPANMFPPPVAYIDKNKGQN